MCLSRQKAVDNKIGDKSTDNVSTFYDKRRQEGGSKEVGAVAGQVWKVGGFIAVACLINFPESQLTCGCGSKSQMNFPLLSQLFGPVPSISDYFPFGFACQIEVCQGGGREAGDCHGLGTS